MDLIKNLKHKNIIILFFVLSFVFYGSTLTNKYCLDDDYITVTNFPVAGQQYVPNHALVKDGLSAIPAIWKSRYAHDNENSFDYRPVITTTFAIEYEFFGQNPFISHFINIILYFITIWLLFNCLLKLFTNHPLQFEIAFITSLLFLIHPLHSEVVASLKSRDEILALLFSLIFYYQVLFWTEDKKTKRFLIALLCLFLGYLSKQSAVLFIAAVPLTFLFYKKTNIKTTLIITIILIYAYLGFSFFSSILVTEKEIRNFYHFENPLFTENVSFLDKIFIAIKTFGFYVKMLIFPYPLRFYYGVNTFDFIKKINLDFFITIIFCISIISYYLKTKNLYFLFASFLFIGFSIPFLNILTPVAGILAERLTYFSSIGFCLMLSIIIAPYFKTSNLLSISNYLKKPVIYLTLLIITCIIYVNNRNSNWYNKLSLFEHDIPYLKKSAKANSILGNEYFVMLQTPNKKYPEQVLLQKALNLYSTSVTNDSTFFSAYNNSGVIYYSYLHDIPNAKKHFKLAIRFKPIYPQAYENLGNCYKAENNIAEAFKCYKKAILINPNFYSSYISCINLFFENKDYKKALAFVGVAQIHYQNNYEITAIKANCYLMMGNLRDAIKYYQLAYKISPNSNLAKYISSQALKVGDTATYSKFYNL